MISPLALTVFSRHRPVGMTLPSRITGDRPSWWARFQRLTQIGGQAGQDGDELLQVAAGGGPRDAMVTGERIGAGAVAEPPQPRHCLPKTRQRPAAARGAPPAPLSQQQPGSKPQQFPGDTERGTIGDHVEPSWRSRSCGETSSTGALRPSPAGPVRPRACLAR
jgi:hypothetical protein